MNNYSVVNGITIINGNSGPYDGKINNPSVKYGRNSIANFFTTYKSTPFSPQKYDASLHAKELDNDKFEKAIEKMDAETVSNLPTKFEYKYMPGEINSQNIDKMALLGAAYEEMGQKTDMPLDELNQKIQVLSDDKNKISADAMDLNGDKKVDIAEYSASILLEDSLSKDPNKADATNISGKVNSQGQKAMLDYFNINNKSTTTQTPSILKDLYTKFALADAQKAFQADPNNLTHLNISA